MPPDIPVQLPAVSKPDGSLSAVVVSGGKQYRVAPGDQVLVDRLSAEPGAEVKFSRVLLLADGDETKIGTPGIDGFEISARVIAHRRGPRIEVLRYKSKKHVRVHRGARADLTAIEILPFGGERKKAPKKASTKEDVAEAEPKAEAESKAEPKAKRTPRKPKATKAAQEESS
jgi:large subunit ribosomal protein L21